MIRALSFAALAVLLLGVSLAAGVIIFFAWVPAADEPPTLIVEATDPGANASAVEQTIAALIEPQVNGVEHLRQAHSRSRRDGSYTLIVSFAAGTDLNLAQTLVQNRVALAVPALPVETQTLGVTIRKQSLDPLLFIALFSPDGSRDAPYLADYGATQLKDELARIPGVAKVSIVGRDGTGHAGFATLDRKPTAVLVVYPLTRGSQREVGADVRARLSELRRRFPEGLDAFTGFDFSAEPKLEASGYLVLDVDPPVGATAEITDSLLGRVDQSLRRLAGVKSVLALSEQPFDLNYDQPCLVVCLGQADGAPVDRERLIREIRREMHQRLVVAGQVASIRVRDLSEAARPRRFGYPIDFAICGPERPRVQALAGQLVARMSKEPGLTDAWADLRTAPSLEPSHLERIDFLPAVSITATPAGELTQAAARSVCERLAAEILPKQQPTEYRLVWLRQSAR